MSSTTPDQQATPEDLEILFQNSCALHEKGVLDEAVKGYQVLLQSLPESAMLHFNCGLALFDLHEYPAAEIHYHKAVQLAPQDPDIQYNRGLNFRRLKQIEDAVQSFESAFKAGDHSLDTLYSLALSYQDLDNFSQAALLYDSILQTDPEHLSTLNNYAYLCHKSGDREKAKSLYQQLVQLDPSHGAAQHMLNSLTGNTPETAPLAYVESIFDNYAQNFEQSLVGQLSYKTPTLLHQQYQNIFPGKKINDCMDLGCGTGLAGLKFSACCKQLLGIDISAEMLAVAEEKDIYDKLIKADILDYLSSQAAPVDLIVAADVLTYMGDLSVLFEKCFMNTVSGGLFLFSVENSDREAFELKESGRFGHSLHYIQQLCEKSGWTICDSHSSNLRKDKEKWIRGTLFILQK